MDTPKQGFGWFQWMFLFMFSSGIAGLITVAVIANARVAKNSRPRMDVSQVQEDRADGSPKVHDVDSRS